MQREEDAARNVEEDSDDEDDEEEDEGEEDEEDEDDEDDDDEEVVSRLISFSLLFVWAHV